MIRLEFHVPEPNEPGYLRRLKRALVFQERIKGALTPELVDEMVAFLADYVTVPETRAEAIEALWDASKEQFDAMFDALMGDDPNA